MVENISKKYDGEWEIYIPAHPTVFKTIDVTPTFSPIPGSDVTFYFEVCYQSIIQNSTCLFLLKLKLVKLSSAFIAPTLGVIVNVQVNYFDGSLFKEYQPQPPTNVHNMDEVTFEDVIQETLRPRWDWDVTHRNFKFRSNTLIIKCKMAFNDHNQLSQEKSDVEMKSSNKYLDLIKNFKSMYEPSMLSDFVFKVGDKSFPAHKFVLAAHSLVFKNMMTHEFLESKTNSVTITDSTPEIFDLFLRSLYSGEIEDRSFDSVKELCYLADKYDVGILKNECTDAAISLLSVDLVCEILKLAYLYSNSALKSAAISFAVSHIKELFPREEWEELVATHPIIGYEVTVNFIPK